MRKRYAYLIWPLLGILTLGLRTLAGQFPHSTEYIYSRGLFVGIRYIWDYSLGLIPAPLLYFLLLALVVIGVKKIRKPHSAKARLTHIGKGFLQLSGIAVVSFFFLWGFNYARIPLPKQIGLEAQQPQGDSLQIWLKRETLHLLESRKTLPFSELDSIPAFSLDIGPLRASLSNRLKAWDIPAPGYVKAYPIAPKGGLIGLGATGIYLPWTGQGQYDASLHHLERPATAAHEMSHALGFTDEGVCNFLGYLACIESEEPLLNYAGQLAVWRALARSAYAFDTEIYHRAYGELPAGIRADLGAIRRRQKRYKGWFPAFSRAVYDRYLRQQGVKGGVASYGRGVLLWEEYRR